MFNARNPALPKPPPFPRASAAPGEPLPGGNGTWADLLKTLPPEGQTPPIVPEQRPELPKPPPSARSTNPWAKENLSRTLLDIGSAFLSSDNFFTGLGAAGKAVGGRMDENRAYNEGLKPKVSYGGPDDRFEITTAPDGSRTIREVPEFAKVLDAKAAEKNRPAVKDVVDQRARAIYAISQLPEAERPAAYAGLMNHPEMYGGIDVSNMPPGWDPSYASVMGGMGATVNQNRVDADRDRAFGHRVQVDTQRAADSQQRLSISRGRLKQSAAGKTKAQAKPPAGFILD